MILSRFVSLRSVPLLAGLALAATALPSTAQDLPIKPGLWELKQKAQLDPQRQAQMDQMQKQLASMSPEQRKMMEQMMAQRGVTLDLNQPGAITIKSCIAKEQADRAFLPKTEGKCSQDVKRNGDKAVATFRCTDPATEGETEIAFAGTDRYTTKSEIRTQRDGKTETIRSTGEARWLGADCGNLKPLSGKP